VTLTRKEIDLEDPGFAARLEALAPKDLSAIVNAAAYTKVDLAESDRENARRANALAPEAMARLALRRGAFLIHYSTDYVYPGDKDGPYLEGDPTGPLNWYGETKLQGDQAVMASGAGHVILRTSWVYGLGGKNFPHTILGLARGRDSLEMDAAQTGSPTGVGLLASVSALIAQGNIHEGKGYQGLFHLCPGGECTWLEFSRFLVGKALECGMDLRLRPEGITPRDGPEPSRAAKRPLNSRLSLERFKGYFGLCPPHWTHYAELFVKTVRDLEGRV
jgi:dTDP-4-dehydrorhamnose reductase